ncbi:unnamed protein product [Effrenium voratum]|uniref:Uncharacterized protein n=1 Tax=Effrenium voratum TaxID=2562239 RepID=A0AA36NBJ9_9DINO|nr:unnamed protein product [Effrenium voratum]
MDSAHFQKNPWLSQVYWAEVCEKEQRPHVFHHTRVRRDMCERTFPISTMKAHFQDSQAMGVVVEKRQPGLPLTTCGRMVSTPRTSGDSRSPQATLSQRGSELGTPRQVGPCAFRGFLATPSRRPPAGAGTPGGAQGRSVTAFRGLPRLKPAGG